MRIERLDVFSFPVPFKVVFRHASASRARAENIIVKATSDCGHTGFGEGCPRDYVTGETVAGATSFLDTIAPAIKEGVHDEQNLKTWIGTHCDMIDDNPAAFCAAETAILDLIGKVKQQPVEVLVDAPRLNGTFQYSAILGDAPYLAYRWQLYRYWLKGLRDFKIKVSGDLHRDKRKLRAFHHKSDPSLRLRLDANNLWTSADACIRHLEALDHSVFAIEEPLQQGDLEGFERVGHACGAKIILDESLSRPDQIASLDGSPWLINLRVSKMGGIIRSLDVARMADAKGIGIIVGAQVGETSILTRAALTVMNAHRANLVASEGAFGTYLLKRDLTTPSLMFGTGGILYIDQVLPIDAPGMGLAVNTRELAPASP
ncbi:MAG: enolase C-terminal domain-like protein [Pseudomonadota bacterium]